MGDRRFKGRRWALAQRRAPLVAALTLAAFSASAADAPKKLSAPPPSPVAAPAPPPPAPMGVFGADMPAAGKFGLSITPNFANLSGHRIGTRGVSSEYIVATTPWYWDPRQKLRLVPQNVAVATQTVGLAYGVTKELAVVVTAGMIEKNLDMLTFTPGAGITRRGFSYTGTGGLQDFTASGIYRVYQDDMHRIQVNLGFAFPTGSTHNTFNLLQPNGTYLTSRAFYAMQPGGGTFDIMPGVVYAGFKGPLSWGLSYRGRLPLAVNPEGWAYGALHEFSGWAGYTVTPGVTVTARALGSTQASITGVDPLIFGKAQAANPNFYGGQRVELFGGATIGGKLVGYENMSIAVEAGAPVYQDLNGPQIMKNWQAGMSLRFKI